MLKRIPVLMMLLCCYSTAFAQEEEPVEEAFPPRIVCDEPTFDFGQANTGTNVTHTWIIRNEGGSPLEITGVRTGCGCTAASMSTNTVFPGEEVELEGTLSLTRRRGPQRKWIMVDSNDTGSKSLSLWFQGMAYEPLKFEPERIVIAQLSTNAAQSRTVRIRAGTDEKTFNINKIETGTPLLTADSTSIKEGEEHDVHIHTHPPFEASGTNLTVKVHTDSPVNPVIEIPVSLYADLGEFHVEPEEIELTPSDGKEVSREIIVSAPGIEAFNIRRVYPPGRSMRTMIAKVKPNRFMIRIRYITPGPDLEGQSVKILTDLEERKEILVPFKFREADSPE